MSDQEFRAWTKFDDGALINVSGTRDEVHTMIKWYAERKGARLIRARIKLLEQHDKRKTELGAFVEESKDGIPLSRVTAFLYPGDENEAVR